MNREDLHKPLEAATRALARKRAVAIRFRDNVPLPEINESETITLPVPGARLSQETLRGLRGEADLAALSLRYHSSKTHALLRPNSLKAAQLFDALERTRIEILGSENWQGVRANLTKRIENYCEQQGYDRLPERADPPIADILALMLRERALGLKPPANVARLVDLWKGWLEQASGKILDTLPAHIADQKQYGMLINTLIKTLEIAGKQEGKDDVMLKQDEESAEEDTPEKDGEDKSEGAPANGSFSSEPGGESSTTGITSSELPPDDASQPPER